MGGHTKGRVRSATGRVLLVAMACFGGLLRPPDAGAAPVFRIGIVMDGPWERNDEIQASFQREILDLTRGEFDVRFPPDRLIQADWSAEGVRVALDHLLNDPEVDLVIAAGVLASNDVCRRGPLPRPVIAPFVLNPQVQGIPFQSGVSGVKNLSYVTYHTDIKRDLEVFREVAPFTRVAFLYSSVISEAVPELQENVLNVTKELNIEIHFVPLKESIEPALAALPAGVEAVYVAPLLGLPAGAFERLVSGLIERRLPSFSVMGASEVERGLLMGLAPESDIPRLARRVALNAQKLLLGEAPSALQVIFTRGERLTVNMATARAIGVSPSWVLLTEAELVRTEREEIGRRLTLQGAVREAVDANLDLAARERAVAAGAQEVREARSPLLPQIDVSGLGTAIDAGLASPLQAERTLSGSGRITQVLFSERAWANLQVQRHLQRSREVERDEVRLSVIQESATAYLNVLRAKTLERIQRDNLKVSRSNLEIAQIRQSVGSSTPAEVYRWESQIATERKAVIEANARRNLAEIALNRALHRPLEEPFVTAEADLDDPHLITRRERLFSFIGNPWSFKTFRNFMVEEGLATSPELRRLDEAIAAQERVLRSAQRAFWSPTVAVQGELSSAFFRGGAGSSLPSLGGDGVWKIGASLSLPLYSGGSRLAAVRKAHEETGRLRLERQAVSERIEQRIRSALHVMGASYAGIRLAREAANAARKNLELVTHVYSQGAVSILDLIDAQNAALVADQVAANAVHTFLIDLMEVERATGRFTFFMSAAEVDALFGRLDAYFARSDVPPGRR